MNKSDQTLQAKLLKAIFDKPGIEAGDIPVAQRRFLRPLEKQGTLEFHDADGGWYYTAAYAESIQPGWKYNVFNPDNIEAGDIVRHDGFNLIVDSVGGRFGNKVFCKEVGHELYANCFTLVRKANAVTQAKWEAEVAARNRIGAPAAAGTPIKGTIGQGQRA